MGKIQAKNQPKARVIENKNEKIEFFFIPALTSTYIQKAVYNLVDFRIKSAGGSNYEGAAFFAPGKKQQNTNI